MLWIVFVVAGLTLQMAEPSFGSLGAEVFEEASHSGLNETDSGVRTDEDDEPVTTQPHPLPHDTVDTLLSNARIPVAPETPDKTAKLCSPACGEGPQLACPRNGDCGTGSICCFDSCRDRQVCREVSDEEEKEKDDDKSEKEM